ncbi:PREDICTED: MLP-like protein 328 [Camelina sativa]|uniref:MLP-like protein 328 n=1 Tax=Camelina sativa TaxID=90675 RepID=A0ABM0URT1_CAMSA|nr:PREDICTED: MLP-like protein 328 [Camelina sativa]
MATSGTYVTEVPLKGSAEKHYKRWKNENHVFPDAIGHHIQNVTVHEGEHDSHGSIRSWNYTWVCETRVLVVYICQMFKEEMFKEKREIDDETKTLTLRGLDGHVMEQLKVYDVIYQFIQKSDDTCVGKITLIWEKRNDDSPEPSGYMKFVKSLVADMDNHVINT